jgi:HPt (histidine-containing phosphotransfer) domain-containing protein
MQDTFYDFVRQKAREHFSGFGFDDATITAILEQGIIDLKANIEKLDQWILEKDTSLEDVAILAHTIKGILANMGLEDIGMRFKNIQILVHDGAGEDEIVKLTEQLIRDLSMLNN